MFVGVASKREITRAPMTTGLCTAFKAILNLSVHFDDMIKTDFPAEGGVYWELESKVIPTNALVNA